jgi:adenosylcobinamide-GDP ribazoletransferase
MNYSELLKTIVTDIRIAVSLCTVLPIGAVTPLDERAVARAGWALPVAGLLVGLAGAATYWIAIRLGLTPGPAAMLALVATILVTGAMHEDGLADAADGLGGGTSRDHKLEIMRDSRVGTYGACALITSIILRWVALAEIGEPELVAIVLLVSHAGARAALPIFMWLVPPARLDGLSVMAGQPSQQCAIIALGLGTLCLIFGFGPSKAMVALLLLALAGLILARLAMRQIGGQTGDILGALEQIGEIAVMLIGAALWHGDLRP